jgi:hypothetical protein
MSKDFPPRVSDSVGCVISTSTGKLKLAWQRYHDLCLK